MDSISSEGVSRRTVLVTGSGAVLGAGVLAACGGSDGTTPSGPSSTASATGGGGGGGTRVLAKVSDVPVGGAVSATDAQGKPLIVAQPAAGSVVAFSAICTHMGCTVAPDGKILRCPCHGSTYDPATGTNTGGPAPRPLTKVTVTVKDGDVVEG